MNKKLKRGITKRVRLRNKFLNTKSDHERDQKACNRQINYVVSLLRSLLRSFLLDSIFKKLVCCNPSVS